MKADPSVYAEVTRTAENVESCPPERRRPEPSGALIATVLCPLCRTTVDLLGVRVEGRCTGCTVLVRMVDGKPRAGGWMGGGDMAKAGAAVKALPSRLENDGTPVPVGPACGDGVGTTAGFHRHKSHHEPPCAPCREAQRQYIRDRRAGRRPARQLQPCGTEAAYRRHMEAGEQPCVPCREARSERVADRARRRALREQAA